uniref:Uncharacterized protein n=1 Tax=Amphimedon queenslandica TaxID=400682 RepID=A0A1X7SSC3_AMPQE
MVVVVPQNISPGQNAESSIHGDCGLVEMPGLGACHNLSLSVPPDSSKHHARVVTDDFFFDTQRLPCRVCLPIISDDESANSSTFIDSKDNISDFDTAKPKKRKVVKDVDDAVPLAFPLLIKCEIGTTTGQIM